MKYWNEPNDPEALDLPLGFGMQLAQDPRAMEAFGRMPQEKKQQMLRQMKDAPTGEEAKARIEGAVEQLHQDNSSWEG